MSLDTDLKTLDGFVLIGVLERIEVRGRTADFEGFTTGHVRSSRSSERVEIARTMKHPMGNIDLPAHAQLLAPDAIGKKWCISIAINRGGDALQYLNYTAIDAVEA